MSAVAPPAALLLRDAVPADNEALIELTAACTMQGDIAMRVDRAPDFFALSRLEGDTRRIGVVTDDAGRVLGCAMAARRRTYVNGVPGTTAYACDLKVHPTARGSGATDILSAYVRDACAELAGPEGLCVLTVLAGNQAMERRARGPRGSPVLSRFATVSVGAIPLLWERRERPAGIAVRSATDADLEEMALVWGRFAPSRQFSAVHDASSLAAWIAGAPGLAIGDYLLATDRSGRIVGLLGIWDQTGFKQMRVVGYSSRLAFVGRAFNAIAPLVGAPRLPAPGGALPTLATIHLCASEPTVLRALLLEAYRRVRGGRFSFMTLCLDVADPLTRATHGLLAQPTRVNAYVSSARGPVDPQPLRGRPLHYEAALV